MTREADALQTFASLEAGVRRRRRRRLLLAVVLAPIASFLLLTVAVASGAFAAWDPDALRRGEWVKVQAAETGPPAELAPGAYRSMEAPSVLKRHVARWIQAVDSLSPGVVTQWDVDAYGNLMVMFDERYDRLSLTQQTQMLDAFGGYYRMHLAALVGDLPGTTRFTPGLIVVDTLPGRPAIRAENRNGAVVIYTP